MYFPTEYGAILQQLEQFDVSRYEATRNYKNGNVSYLSPYLSRGILSTKQVLNSVLNRYKNPKQYEKFLQELAWREYWQRVWQCKQSEIEQDMRNAQSPVLHYGIPAAVLHANTGIEAIDEAIMLLYKTGYIHNHMRMYIAALCCNIGKYHWSIPARWMYYHLLDADLASNALSWQWIAGTFSHKKYIANQENINKYFNSNQRGTFLDTDYQTLSEMAVPDMLKIAEKIDLIVCLPESPEEIQLDPNLPLLIYNVYHLDPCWMNHIDANRILLLEPSILNAYPMSEKSIQFVMALAKNIPDIQIVVAEFNDVKGTTTQPIYFKQHPMFSHYVGESTTYDFIFKTNGFYPSFSAFWKQCQKEIKTW